MGKRADRLNEIVNFVDANGASRIKDLSMMLGVTQVTIRRDLQELEREKRIRVLHGVAAPNDEMGRVSGYSTYRIDEAEYKNIEAKKAIASHAASLIREGEIIYLDPGTTTELVARMTDPSLSITVVTAALNISDYVARHTDWRLVNPGGTLHRGPMMFEGSGTVELLQRTRTHRAFISASGIGSDLSVTCTNLYEIEMKQAAIQSARESALVVYHTKFGTVQIACFADIDDFSLIISDQRIDETIAGDIEQRGVRLVRTPFEGG